VTSAKVLDSGTVSVACVHFHVDVRDWVRDCIRDFASAPPLDGHDQGTFTAAWEPYIKARADEEALEFMTDLRDRTRDFFVSTGRWKHGYWSAMDVHHGTEHFELFLGALWRLKPDDEETIAQLIDAAEHLGNWVPGIPAWFDWDRGLFLGLHFGTEGVRPVPWREAFNIPDHLRCVNVLLLAHAMTGEQRYLDLARTYGGRWSDAIMSGEELPVALNRQGAVYFLAKPEEGSYRAFAGQIGKLRPEVDRAENFLASGAVDALLRLWQLTSDERFRTAAERLLDVIVTQLTDPDAGPAADAVRTYRRATGDGRYDSAVLDAVEALTPFSFSTLSIEPEVTRDERPPGIGKRKDMPLWYEDGSPRRHNPILLAVAAEVTEDQDLATRSADIARAYFHLARQVYPHGRNHGCSARSVSAVARGHGRDNNAGVVTAVLGPILDTFEHLM